MNNPIEALMYGLSQLFLPPVLLAIALLFGYAFYAFGGFAWQALQRYRGDAAGFELQWARAADSALAVAELEALAASRLECARIASRVAPMLGLVATMIPMGPALQALGNGQLAAVSHNLTVAFSAVILSLIAASLTYGVVQVRRRWYAAELIAIECEHGR